MFVFIACLTTNSFAAPADLSPEALDCYEKVINNPALLAKSREYRNRSQVEKLVVSLCTYSNAYGATKCYLDAKADPQILAGTKEVTNIIAIEEKYVRLCSNSKGNQESLRGKDVDAVDCFKSIDSQSDLLPMLRGATRVEFEKNLTNLCISSNGKGATMCLRNAMANPDRVLEEGHQHLGPRALELEYVRLCKGSRVR